MHSYAQADSFHAWLLERVHADAAAAVDATNHNAWGALSGKVIVGVDTAPPRVFEATHATTLYNTSRYAECVAVCRVGIEAGDPKAQYLLARCCCTGLGTDKDEVEGVRLAELSAAQNEPLGQ